MDVWDNKSRLELLEHKRMMLRSSGRLSFDCYNLHCRGDRAVCNKGRRISMGKHGDVNLLSVLQGRTSGQCRICSEYEGD